MRLPKYKNNNKEEKRKEKKRKEKRKEKKRKEKKRKRKEKKRKEKKRKEKKRKEKKIPVGLRSCDLFTISSFHPRYVTPRGPIKSRDKVLDAKKN